MFNEESSFFSNVASVVLITPLPTSSASTLFVAILISPVGEDHIVRLARVCAVTTGLVALTVLICAYDTTNAEQLICIVFYYKYKPELIDKCLRIHTGYTKVRLWTSGSLTLPRRKEGIQDASATPSVGGWKPSLPYNSDNNLASPFGCTIRA